MTTPLPTTSSVPISSPLLYKTDQYALYADRVVQGKHYAKAVSSTELQAQYQSPAAPFNRQIAFKFSLNGKDNELPFGVNHHLLLLPNDKGEIVSPLYIFGQIDSNTAPPAHTPTDGLPPNTTFTLRLDMRPVLQAFAQNGYYTDYNGNKLAASDFKGVFVAGDAEPLSWDFENLPSRPQFQLTDPDNDGIYTLTLLMNPYNPDHFTARSWKATEPNNTHSLPQYQSPQMLCDALFRLSLDEMVQCIRTDSTYMAGEKWPGVWTRDASYSILLALAILQPDIAQRSLMAKVKNGKIIQDTGTGGAWPVSTDRMTWALAAYEVYKANGDAEWLQTAYNIISQSAEDDLKTVYDESLGLMRGESSFLDWRKQTYPAWLNPADIYASYNLGTNAVHAQTYYILSKMSAQLHDTKQADRYQKIAQQLQQGINRHLWLPEKQYYAQYLYGNAHTTPYTPVASPRAEALGEVLCVLFNLTDAKNKQHTPLLQHLPLTSFGATCIYPQIPDIPPYHNNGIWPFVQGYVAWAAAQTGNESVLQHSLGSIYRAAALFLTNKENMVADTGDFRGTEINSDRQLWSVAANLATVLRVFMGIRLNPSNIVFEPAIPKSYEGTRTLSNLHYRNAIIDVTIIGYGKKIKRVSLNGKLMTSSESTQPIPYAIIKGDAQGKQSLVIEMANEDFPVSQANLVANATTLPAPKAKLDNNHVSWQPVEGAVRYIPYRNGIPQPHITQLPASQQLLPNETWQFAAIDAQNNASFLSEPISAPLQNDELLRYQAENFAPLAPLTTLSGYEGKGVVELTPTQHSAITFSVDLPKSGTYKLFFRYSNGSGPINTDNKCALRSLHLDGKAVGVVVMPQMGFDEWSNWQYSPPITLQLPAGKHSLLLSYEPHNENMNGDVNRALLDALHLVYISE